MVYINDVTDLLDVDVKCKLYADDVKLYAVIDSGVTNSSTLQNTLNRLSKWSDDWQLTISASKCVTINIGKHETN